MLVQRTAVTYPTVDVQPLRAMSVIFLSDRQTGRQTGRQAGGQTDIQTGRQPGRQTDRQAAACNFAHMRTCVHLCITTTGNRTQDRRVESPNSLKVRMHACMHTRVHTHTCACVHVYTCTHMCARTHTHMQTHVGMHMRACVHMCACICTCMCVCVCVQPPPGIEPKTSGLRGRQLNISPNMCTCVCAVQAPPGIEPKTSVGINLPPPGFLTLVRACMGVAVIT